MEVSISLHLKCRLVYVHPQVDQAPPRYPVQVQLDVRHVRSVEEAVKLYLTAFRQQFISEEGAARRALWLNRLTLHRRFDGCS
jgi:hypothetical protein